MGMGKRFCTFRCTSGVPLSKHIAWEMIAGKLAAEETAPSNMRNRLPVFGAKL
jgi:hypothetical protein